MTDPASALEAALEGRLDDLLKAAVPPGGDTGGDTDGVRLAVATIFSYLRTLRQALGADLYAANVHGLVAEMAVLVGMEQETSVAPVVTADSATTGAAFAKAAEGMAALAKEEGK